MEWPIGSNTAAILAGTAQTPEALKTDPGPPCIKMTVATTRLTNALQAPQPRAASRVERAGLPTCQQHQEPAAWRPNRWQRRAPLPPLALAPLQGQPGPERPRPQFRSQFQPQFQPLFPPKFRLGFRR